MRLIAHRGCAARGPENTLGAIERAQPHVDAVEVDVRRCGSGEVVVVHDATLDRLMGLDRRVSETDSTTLQTHAVLDSTETIPRLTDVVDVLSPAVGLNVELKEQGLAADVEDAVAGHADVWVSSFDADALCETTLPRAFLFDDDWAAGLATALDLDCVAVHPHYDLVHGRGERVAEAHERGFQVNVWTPPVDVLTSLRAVGVDGAIVDDWPSHR